MSLLELLVVFIVALVVIGPEQLPNLIYQGSKLLKTVRKFGDDMSLQLKKEIKAEELKNKKESIIENFDSLMNDKDK